MAKVLITGGAGFIGANLAVRLVNEKNEVTVIDDLSMGKETNLPIDKLTFYQHSITDEKFMCQILNKNKFDYIFLMAAVASVADSIKRPFETHEVNQEANIQILELIRTLQLQPKKILFASSAAVYGNTPILPKSENSAIAPATPYAIDKFSTERFLLTYAKLYQLNAVAVRFFNVFGPLQNPQSPYSGVLSILTAAVKENRVFKMMGDGEQSRDFIYIADVVDALELLTIGSSAKGDVYNVATGQETSLNQVVTFFEKITNKEIRIETVVPRIGDIRNSFANIDKLKKLGYRPKTTLMSGLAQYWEYMKIHD